MDSVLILLQHLVPMNPLVYLLGSQSPIVVKVADNVPHKIDVGAGCGFGVCRVS